MFRVVDCLLLVLCVELWGPKNRGLEVTTSRVERLGLVVTRQVRMHGLLLLWLVARQGKGSSRSRLLREIGSSCIHRNRGSNSLRKLLEMVLRWMGVGNSNGMDLLLIRRNMPRGGSNWVDSWLHRGVGERLRVIGGCSRVTRVWEGGSLLQGGLHTHRDCRVHRGCRVDRRRPLGSQGWDMLVNIIKHLLCERSELGY